MRNLVFCVNYGIVHKKKISFPSKQISKSRLFFGHVLSILILVNYYCQTRGDNKTGVLYSENRPELPSGFLFNQSGIAYSKYHPTILPQTMVARQSNTPNNITRAYCYDNNNMFYDKTPTNVQEGYLV